METERTEVNILGLKFKLDHVLSPFAIIIIMILGFPIVIFIMFWIYALLSYIAINTMQYIEPSLVLPYSDFIMAKIMATILVLLRIATSE